MSFRSSWSPIPHTISRRFSTLEGWRSIGDGIYTAGPSVRVLSIRHQFDPESYDDDRTSTTCRSREECASLRSRVAGSVVTSNSLDAHLETKSRASSASSNSFDVSRTADSSSDQEMIIQTEEIYHIFTRAQKWSIIALIGIAGLFSGLSSNIYFPALDAIAQDLRVSLNSVSLTITTYLIFQGLSPLIWGSLSDTIGRRPIYIYSFLLYIAANIGLSFSPNFAVLLVFRGLQAAGSASTVSIGNGVIQDITPPAERGGFISFYQAIRNFSIAAGPVLGGLLSQFLGFRSIFIFLTILSTLTLVAIVIFLPETLRSIAGDGRLRLTGIYQPLNRVFGKEPLFCEDRDENFVRQTVTINTFFEPLLLLKEKDILLSLIFGGVVYAIWSMVTSSTTGLFKQAFQLNELLVGVSFIPNGIGTIIGSTIIGNLMNSSYKQAEKTYNELHNFSPSHAISKKSLPPDFPIEHTRLEHIRWITVLFVLTTSLYGISFSSQALLSRPGWIAIPLILQFFIAATSNAIFAINQTMISDLCPGKGASSTAVNNLVRCTLGALGVAFIEQLIETMGVAAAFVGLALITVCVSPLAVFQWYYAAGWRNARNGDNIQTEKGILEGK